MQLNMFDETIELTKQLEEGDEVYECNRCKKQLPPEAYSTSALKGLRAMADPDQKISESGASGGTALCCKVCRKEYDTSRRDAIQKAPPRPTGETFTCECCHNVMPIKKLRFDHEHGTSTFRGWLCNNCNAGLGNLGDTVEGLEKAIRYLKKNER